MKVTTIALIAVGGVLGVAAAVFIPGRLHQSARDAATARFRDTAIAEVTRLTADLSAVTNQVAAMAKQTEEEDKWLSQHIIVMKSGEWVVFVSKCSKEDPKIRDTFVCRASDGRSYESSFHFCKGVIVLRMEGQPEHLRSFITDHKLTPLQGRPNRAGANSRHAPPLRSAAAVPEHILSAAVPLGRLWLDLGPLDGISCHEHTTRTN